MQLESRGKKIWAETVFEEIMAEIFLKLINDIKSDSSMSKNPTPNNTNKTIHTEAQQSITTENQKQREKSLKPSEEKRDSFQRSKNKTDMAQTLRKLMEARKNVGPLKTMLS